MFRAPLVFIGDQGLLYFTRGFGQAGPLCCSAVFVIALHCIG